MYDRRLKSKNYQIIKVLEDAILHEPRNVSHSLEFTRLSLQVNESVFYDSVPGLDQVVISDTH